MAYAVGTGSVGERDLHSLATAKHGLEAGIGKHLIAAELSGLSSHDPTTVLKAHNWAPVDANKLMTAARFAHRVSLFYPQIWAKWLAGDISTAQVAALAANTENLSIKVVGDIVTALTPTLADLTPRQITKAAAKLIALNDPDQPNKEHRDYDNRRLTIRRRSNAVGQRPASHAGR